MGKTSRKKSRTILEPDTARLSSPEIPQPKPASFWPTTLLLIALVWLAYWPALQCGFIWDDDTLVTENHSVTNPNALQALQAIWLGTDSPDYFPVTSTSFWLEWQFWGASPSSFHVTNILLHCLSVIIFWRILAAMNLPGSVLAAALFAIHPITVESVTWIAERKNTLSLVFYLLSLFLWLKFLDADMHRPRFYAAALICFTLALLAKTSVVMLPFILLLLIWWRRKRLQPKDIFPVIPFFLAAVILGLVTMHFQSDQGLSPDTLHRSMAERLAQAGVNLWFYLYKTLAPIDLATVYPEVLLSHITLWTFIPGALWCAVLVATFYYRRSTIGRALLMAFAFFTLNLAPVLGILNMAWTAVSPTGDHFIYISILGILPLFVAALLAIFRSMPRLRIPLAAAGSIAMLSLLILTWAQIVNYKSMLDLFGYNVRVRPASAMAHNAYGSALKNAGRLPEAAFQWQEAVRLNPHNYSAQFELGTYYFNAHQYQQSATYFAAVISIHPAHSTAFLKLAEATWRGGNPDAAARMYQSALQSQPKDFAICFAYGNMLEEIGQPERAIAAYTAAIAIDPWQVGPQYNKGNCLLTLNRPADAIPCFEAALRIDPKKAEAWFNLSVALHAVGHDTDAQVAFSKAIALKPELAPTILFTK